MTENQALRLMSKLIVCTNGWDEASIRAWTAMLMNLTDPPAAEQAVNAVCASWGMASRPPWGKVMESYQAQPRDDQLGEAGSTAPRMSFYEYLMKLKQSALAGNRDAARELESWKHHIATSNVWLSAIGGEKLTLADLED